MIFVILELKEYKMDENIKIKLREELGKLAIRQKEIQQKANQEIEKIIEQKNFIIFQLLDSSSKTEEESKQLYKTIVGKEI